MRYFRSSPETYENIRKTLDKAWGLPNSAGTQTCYAPLSDSILNNNNMALLAVKDEFSNYSVISDLLPQLLQSGDIEEITELTYWSEIPNNLLEE